MTAAVTDNHEPLSISEAARLLGISTATANRMIQAKTFPIRVTKLGARRKVLRGDLVRYCQGLDPDIKSLEDIETAAS